MSNQESALDFTNPENQVQFIRAGAGAGKTTTLIKTCIDFVQQFKKIQNKYPKIIITTFTTKATQEIKERLIIEALKTGDEELFQYFNKKSFVQIGTIHGILSQFLRQYAETIGLPAQVKISHESKFLFHIKKHLKSIFQTSQDFQILLDHVNFNQLVYFLYKSTLLKQEYSYFQPIKIEALIEAAALEKEKVLKTINTFLDYENELKEKWSVHFGFVKKIEQAIKNESYSELENVYDDKPKKFTLGRKDPELNKDLDTEIAELYKSIPLSPLSFKNQIEEVNNLNIIYFKLVDLVSEYLTQKKIELSEVVISDLELLSLKIIEKDPSTIKNFAQQYNFIMVDEYQDTSPLQVKILDQLMPLKNISLSTKNFDQLNQFIVGDPQQSIYLFRGARSEVFINKENSVEKLGYKTKFQMKNYRSSARLMTFLNVFFKSYSPQFEPMETKNQNFSQPAYPEASFITAEINEYAAVLDKIRYLQSQSVNLSEITILFKKNSDILDFAKYANQFSLPTQIQISQGFEFKSEIIDLVCLLKFFINPYDNLNLIQLVRSPWFSISDQDILNLRSDRTDSSFWIQLKKCGHECYQFLKHLETKFLEEGVSKAVIYFLQKSAFAEASFFLDPTTRRESNIWKFIQVLTAKESDKNFNLSEFVNLEFNQINEDLSSGGGEGIPLQVSNRVSLMTIHGSKGLQFSHVIILGCNAQVREKPADFLTFNESDHSFCLKYFMQDQEKSFSTDWSKTTLKQYTQRLRDENDRLLYVAMTRAIDSVTLIKKTVKKTPKNTWLEKINWSEDFFKAENYKVDFHTVNSEPEKFLDIFLGQQKIMQPLQLEKSNQTVAGVTEILQTLDQVMGELDHMEIVTESESQKVVLRTLNTYNKAQKGSDLHKFFEALKYNEFEDLTAQLSAVERKAIGWMVSQKIIDLKQILSFGFVEWGFGLNFKSVNTDPSEKIMYRQIQGQIDAWGVLNEEVFIIDYKTGSQKYLDKAIKQLHFYAKCLLQMKKINLNQKINLVVIYPFDEHIDIQSLTRDELNQELFI